MNTHFSSQKVNFERDKHGVGFWPSKGHSTGSPVGLRTIHLTYQKVDFRIYDVDIVSSLSKEYPDISHYKKLRFSSQFSMSR